MTEPITAYCFKCREKRPIPEPQATFNKRGGPITRGLCPVCGTKMVRSGRTAAHEGLSKPEPPPKPRSGKLVIVESPAKARTIGRILGKGYKVMASVGHVRDLLRSQLSVDIENDFEPRYRVPNEKRAIVKELTAAAARAETIYLATDLDREGEAIAWHLVKAAAIEPGRIRRVVFHEITAGAITEAFAHPAEINMDLVDAQQARRILDRLVGYQISPLLWVRVRNRLTAGRVQSVAVRLIVERQREIDAFQPREYWTLAAELAKGTRKKEDDGRPFTAELHRHIDVELDTGIGDERSIDLPNQAAVAPILDALQNGHFQVKSVRSGQRRRAPQAPFTTSTLQQTASSQLNFRAQRTMRVAQQLYEGLDLGEGDAPESERVGLITYMRTDSVAIAAQAQQEARDFILQTYGAAHLPDQPPQYKTRTKKAQEAHEAIRPTSVGRTPQSVKSELSRDQFRLYQLIWQRFLASQMNPALYQTQTVTISAGPDQNRQPYLFRASGSQLAFPGYLVVYLENNHGRGDSRAASTEPATGTRWPAENNHGRGGSRTAPTRDNQREKAKILPPLVEGEQLALLRLLPEQHFTQPPPHYSEATLVKALEEHGIGRPSTYAPIIATIRQRGYIETGDSRGGSRTALHPTELGILVNDLLVEHFGETLSFTFTAEMEEGLDRIAAGETDWVPVLRRFYTPFAAQLAAAEENMPEMKLGDQPVGRDCPQCSAPLLLKWGRYGKFIACQDYPTCKHTEPWLDKIGVSCPQCDGDLVRKRTRKGRPFYACANYPTCDFTSWKRPLPTPCPRKGCNGLLVVQNQRQARCLACEESFAIDTLEP